MLSTYRPAFGLALSLHIKIRRRRIAAGSAALEDSGHSGETQAKTSQSQGGVSESRPVRSEVNLAGQQLTIFAGAAFARVNAGVRDGLVDGHAGQIALLVIPIKSNGDLVRQEVEIPITTEHFYALAEMVAQPFITALQSITMLPP